MKSHFGAIILSGGKSERMNYPKAFLEIEGDTFLNKIINLYKKKVSEIVIVLNNELAESKWKNYSENIDIECKIVLNHHSEKGKFYSLQLGTKNISCDYCFIQNIDNPFIHSSVLDKLIKNKNLNGITIPTYNTKSGHPILVSKNVIEKISLSEDTNKHLKDFYSAFSKKFIAVEDESILININTREDYSTAFPKFKTLENVIR